MPFNHPDDWQFQACRARPDGPVYLYQCGVSGICSIAYWCSRLGGALVRLTSIVADPSDSMWMMLVADDLKLESTGPEPQRSILFVILLWLVLGVSFSWAKV